MENESRLSRLISNITDRIQEQVWFQQLKTKWDELDPRARTAIKYGSTGGGMLLLLVLVLSFLFGVSTKRDELEEKTAMVRRIQLAQEELRRLRTITSSGGLAGGEEWTAYVQAQAVEAGIAAESVNVTEKKAAAPSAPAKKPGSKEVAPPPAASSTEESLIQVTVKKVNVKQLMRLVFQLENGPRTTKVRNLQVDTEPDESGYLDITLALSGFTLNKEP